MPVRAVEHQTRARPALQQFRRLDAGRGMDAFLLGAAFGIQGVQLRGQTRGGRVVFFAQQLQGQLRRAHAPGGVDARGQTEDHLPAAQGSRRVKAADHLEGRHAGPRGSGQRG